MMDLIVISDDLGEYFYLLITHPWISLIWFDWQRWWKWESMQPLMCDYKQENIWTDAACIAQVVTAFTMFIAV